MLVLQHEPPLRRPSKGHHHGARRGFHPDPFDLEQRGLQLHTALCLCPVEAVQGVVGPEPGAPGPAVTQAQQEVDAVLELRRKGLRLRLAQARELAPVVVRLFLAILIVECRSRVIGAFSCLPIVMSLSLCAFLTPSPLYRPGSRARRFAAASCFLTSNHWPSSLAFRVSWLQS